MVSLPFLVRFLFALLAGARGLCSFFAWTLNWIFLLVRARKVVGTHNDGFQAWEMGLFSYLSLLSRLLRLLHARPSFIVIFSLLDPPNLFLAFIFRQWASFGDNELARDGDKRY